MKIWNVPRFPAVQHDDAASRLKRGAAAHVPHVPSRHSVIVIVVNLLTLLARYVKVSMEFNTMTLRPTYKLLRMLPVHIHHLTLSQYSSLNLTLLCR
jgi:hypothetical protein